VRVVARARVSATRERGGDNRVEKRPRRASAVNGGFPGRTRAFQFSALTHRAHHANRPSYRDGSREIARLGPFEGPSRDLENGGVVVARGTPRARSIVKSRTLFEIQRGDESEIRIREKERGSRPRALSATA